MSNPLSNKEFFNSSHFFELNGPGYKPSDIRTYKMQPLANTPAADVEVHLSVPNEGGRGRTLVRTNLGNFSGDQSIQTEEKASRSVLHFPTPTIIDTPKGIVKTDSIKLVTLYPSWIVTRYSQNDKRLGVTTHHPVPLFLDKKTKQFLYFFDESFLDEIDPKELTQNVDRKHWSVYKGKDGRKHLALTTYNFTDILNIGDSRDEENPVNLAFKGVRANYKRLMIDAQSLEKVIVAQYQFDSRQPRPIEGAMPDGDNRILGLHFFKAARHENTYYRITEDGSLDTRVSVSVTRSSDDKDSMIGRNQGAIGRNWAQNSENVVTVVLPFTDQDWDHLVHLSQALSQLQNDLWSLFKGCESNEAIDRSLGESAKALPSSRLLNVLSEGIDGDQG